MSTFGALNTAYRGLTAAQQGMNVAGQNIANAATEGYTRQRVQQSSIVAPAQGLFGSGRPEAGNGVSVDGIARLGSSFLDSGVRSTAAQSGYASARSSALQGIEGMLQEPGENGISTALQGFWSAWQGAANQPNDSAAKGLVLQAGNDLATKVSSSYRSLEDQWSSVRGQAQGAVDAVNAAATQVAAFNTSIRSTLAAGGSANELIDARAKLTETISRLTGGTVREQADGTVDVHVGGNALVMGSSVRALALSGSQTADKLGTAVQLEWADRPGAAIAVADGEIAGALSVLAPASERRRHRFGRAVAEQVRRRPAGRGQRPSLRRTDLCRYSIGQLFRPGGRGPCCPRPRRCAQGRRGSRGRRGGCGEPGRQPRRPDLTAWHWAGVAGQRLGQHRHRDRCAVTRRPAA